VPHLRRPKSDRKGGLVAADASLTLGLLTGPVRLDTPSTLNNSVSARAPCFEQPQKESGKLSGLAACGYGGPTLTMSDLTALTITVVVRLLWLKPQWAFLIIHPVS